MIQQKLQQKLSQKLSPQQIQMIKLLEIPTMQLEDRIKKELEENPALEEGAEEIDFATTTIDEEVGENNDKDNEEFTIDDYIDDDYDIPEYRLYANNYSRDDIQRSEIVFSVGSSFQDLLIEQLSLRNLTERQLKIGEYILGNIDEDGYLRREIVNIVDDLAFMQNIETDESEVENVLKEIQDLDPVGVGARSVQECLLIQLKKKREKTDSVECAILILEKYFTEFSKRHYDAICSKLNIGKEALKGAVEEILRLNPRPGDSGFDNYSPDIHHIIPDFILEQTDNGLDLHLNSRNAPELRLNNAYSEMLREYSNSKSSKEMKDAALFIKQKIDSAKWFIDAIQQRQNSMLLTMNAILKYQYEYFIDGDESKLRPMVLKDIAELTALDISTVSRVANSKYIETPFGTYPLKYFFSEGLQTDTGEEVSTREIKKILQECVEKESKQSPLTDERLTEILQEKGYHIARRTVAKYRELLNIPVARLRKEI